MVNCVESVQALIDSRPGSELMPEAAAALAAGRAIDLAASERLSGAAQQGVSSMVGRYLEAVAALRALAPEGKRESRLDEIRARRDAKVRAQGGVGSRGADASVR
jgi:hypothetical protein